MKQIISKPKQLFNGTNIFCRVEFLVIFFWHGRRKQCEKLNLECGIKI